MRELVFRLEYEPGYNELADVLASHPEVRIRSLSLHATPESLWRVDHVSGAGEALETVEETFLTTDYYADCLATDYCGATQRTQVLEHAADTLVLYSYWERTPACSSVPHLALEYLGDGALFETRHEGRVYTWRIIHTEAGDVRGFFEALETAIGDCATVTIDRLTEANPPSDRSGTGRVAESEESLPEEQARALLAAVEYGYYETPRELSLGELADELDIPRSTLTYRLRRAESHLASQYVAAASPVTDLSS